MEGRFFKLSWKLFSWRLVIFKCQSYSPLEYILIRLFNAPFCNIQINRQQPHWDIIKAFIRTFLLGTSSMSILARACRYAWFPFLPSMLILTDFSVVTSKWHLSQFKLCEQIICYCFLNCLRLFINLKQMWEVYHHQHKWKHDTIFKETRA